jgi:hypothetical protein
MTTRTQGTGYQHAKEPTVRRLLAQLSTRYECRQIEHPYYAWCGEYRGHTIEMIPVEVSHGGPGASWSEEIHLAINGEPSRYRMCPDGQAANLADYLRGGHWGAPVGVSLQDTEAISTHGPVLAGVVTLSEANAALLDRMIAD